VSGGRRKAAASALVSASLGGSTPVSISSGSKWLSKWLICTATVAAVFFGSVTAAV
jgi:hypothetical protein